MVFSDFTDFFSLIISKLIINPLFVILHETIMILLLLKITFRMLKRC